MRLPPASRVARAVGEAAGERLAVLDSRPMGTQQIDARREAKTTPLVCHACNAPIEGEPGGHGVLVFPRGDDVVREELPLCDRCALAVGMSAWWRFAEQEEEG